MVDEWDGTHRVTDEMQRWFVAASGDSNPLHTDPVVARRLPFGRVAVHGMHLALDALDRLAAQTDLTPRRIRCTFRRSVGIDDELDVRVTMRSDLEARILVAHDVWTVADLQVTLAAEADTPRTVAGGDGSVPAPVRRPPIASPYDLPITALPGATGSIEVLADADGFRTRFPSLGRVMGSFGVAELVSLTRLIGMEVPGLHSLFSSFDVTVRPGDGGRRLHYTVRRFDDRFAKATIDVSGPTLTGSVAAFVRPRPVDPTTGTATPRPDEFAGQRWLVVGGSRGLGATTSMLLTLGGADVRLTYRIGADDAEHLASSIGAVAHRLDASRPEQGIASVTGDGWRPTHVAYFASPPIFDGAGGAYSAALERRFASIYLDGFEAVLGLLGIEGLLGALWPSSDAVDHDVAGLAEYAAVKRRGEALCAELARRHDHLIMSAPRLPRLRTDQTASFLPVDYDDAPTVMLEALRVFSG